MRPLSGKTLSKDIHYSVPRLSYGAPQANNAVETSITKVFVPSLSKNSYSDELHEQSERTQSPQHRPRLNDLEAPLLKSQPRGGRTNSRLDAGEKIDK